MLWYLDSVISIYHLDGVAPFKARADLFLTGLSATSESIALSDLVRLEYRVKPLRNKDHVRLAIFDTYFWQPHILKLPMTTSVFDRAAEIRASYKFKLADALHLAVAIEGSCDRFLTNDHRLSKFTGITIEVLP